MGAALHLERSVQLHQNLDEQGLEGLHLHLIAVVLLDDLSALGRDAQAQHQLCVRGVLLRQLVEDDGRHEARALSVVADEVGQVGDSGAGHRLRIRRPRALPVAHVGDDGEGLPLRELAHGGVQKTVQRRLELPSVEAMGTGSVGLCGFALRVAGAARVPARSNERAGADDDREGQRGEEHRRRPPGTTATGAGAGERSPEGPGGALGVRAGR
mmetsp:Transcript_40494/g.114514  ORF Transcript_40494/g.114514 Transcript_40494/m.114514 type:complete len:213 (-) Transcript_40494:150-788(-)